MLAENRTKTAVILLSGGLDSSTCLALAREQGFRCHALSFAYGQRHAQELQAARRVAAALGVERHLILELDLRPIGGSALTADIPVPKGRAVEEMSRGVPVTYVPARNTLFLSLAAAWAETLQATDIFIGVNALDYSGYPDCRPEFIELFQALADYSTKAAVQDGRRIVVETPLLHLAKKDIVLLGAKLGAPLHLTSSCYAGGAAACGKCDSCLLRLKGFAEAGIQDPIAYQEGTG